MGTHITSTGWLNRTLSAVSLSLVGGVVLAEGPSSQPALLADAPTSERPAEIPSDSDLEALGAVIGNIEVQIDNIFDLSDPEENKALYRAANKLHVKTHDRVVVSLLVFESGDPYSRRLLDESERELRDKSYLFDATIRPVHYDAERNVVDVKVETRDVWTLSPELSFGRSGGVNTYRIGLGDSNLFGTGKDLQFVYSSGIDRDSARLRYIDPNVRGKRTRLQVTYADNSDGFLKQFALERPFYSLDTRWAAGTNMLDNVRVDPIYSLGQIIDQFQQDETFFLGFGGRSRGLIDNVARRWTLGYTYHRSLFAPAPGLPPPSQLPEDRTLSYPWIGLEIVEDEFAEAFELDQIGRTEDIALGHRVGFLLGWSDEVLGADRDAAIFGASGSMGFEPSEKQLLLFFGGASGRWETEDDFQNVIVNAAARYYHRNFGRHLFFVRFDTTVTENLDLENQVLLGGDTGLRGYPLRYQAGTAKALLRLEQRIYTDWYPFRFVRIGSAVFFDVGRTWGQDAWGTPNLGLLSDVGFGLRFSSTRISSDGMLHVDLAFPLNGDESIDQVQLIIGTKASF